MAWLTFGFLVCKNKLSQKQANRVVGLGSKLKHIQISDLFLEKQIVN